MAALSLGELRPASDAIGAAHQQGPDRAHPQSHLASLARRDRCRWPAANFSRRQCIAPDHAFKLSLRIPPLVDGDQAAMALRALLESDPPNNACVSFVADTAATGWNAPESALWF